MQAGLGVLALSPRDFWAMTPRELDAALRGRLGIALPTPPLAGPDLARLMQKFPDREFCDRNDS